MVPDRPELPGVESAAALDASREVGALGKGAADVVGGRGGHGSPLGGRAVGKEKKEVNQGRPDRETLHPSALGGVVSEGREKPRSTHECWFGIPGEGWTERADPLG